MAASRRRRCLRRGAESLGALIEARRDESRRLGVILLVTVVVAWGLTWPVNKVILASVPPLWAVALRTAIGSVALFAIAAATRRLALPPRGDLPVLLSITVLHMIGFAVLSTIGLQYVPTGRSAVLAYTTPLWVAPGAALFLGERLDARRMLGVAIGLTGLVVLFNPLAFDWTKRAAVLGNLAILGAALLWAASILHIRGHPWQSTPFDLLPWETALATLILAPVAYLATGPLRIAWNPPLVAMVLYAGVPGTALAYWAVAMAGRHLPAITTSLGLLVTPLVSIAVAMIWLFERPTPSLLAAVGLILSGIAIGATRDSRNESAS
jgi:drug/metabolite transporter (DMT)-like permease